jgi:hypothetical protein
MQTFFASSAKHVSDRLLMYMLCFGALLLQPEGCVEPPGQQAGTDIIYRHQRPLL